MEFERQRLDRERFYEKCIYRGEEKLEYFTELTKKHVPTEEVSSNTKREPTDEVSMEETCSNKKHEPADEHLPTNKMPVEEVKSNMKHKPADELSTEEVSSNKKRESTNEFHVEEVSSKTTEAADNF